MADLLAAARAYLAGTGDPPDRHELAAEVVRLAEELDAERSALDIADAARVDALQAHADAAEMLAQVAAERDLWLSRYEGEHALVKRIDIEMAGVVVERRDGFAARDAALDACQRRIAEVMRERDEARAALAEASAIDRDAIVAAIRRHAAEWEHVENVSQALSAVADEIAAGAPARPPLDSTHVEVLRDMKHSSEALLADADDGTETYRRLLGQRIAALEAVLGGGICTGEQLDRDDIACLRWIFGLATTRLSEPSVPVSKDQAAGLLEKIERLTSVRR